MREDDNLRPRRDVGQHAKCCGASIIVKLHQHIVNDKWHRLSCGARRFDGGET